MQENNTTANMNIPEPEEESVNFRALLDRYLVEWKWFALGILVCLGIAYTYLRYAVPQYKSSSTILVRDEKKGGLQSELSAFADMGLMTGAKNNVDNEIEILKSRSLIEKTVRKLNFQISYYSNGSIKTTEIYSGRPFDFSIQEASEGFYTKPQIFEVISNKSNTFELLDSKERSLGKFNFGVAVVLKEVQFILYKIPSIAKNSVTTSRISVHIQSIEAAAASYSSRLTVNPISKTTSVVELSLTDPIKEKAEHFLNNLVEIYNQEAVEDKNMISESTQNFIQERLKSITTELGAVEADAEGFKKANSLTDLVTDASLFVQTASEFEKALITAETQLRVVDVMTDFMRTKTKADLVPANIIPTENVGGMINPIVVKHNDLVLQRNRIIKDGTAKNYILINLNQQLDDIDRNIKESLAQLKASLTIRKNDLVKQDQILKGKITQIPTQERAFRIIDRQQKIKESLYLYLLQKREETAITLAVTEANAKIIDPAATAAMPVSPKKNIIYLAALILGLLIPFGVLYIIDLLDTKIKTRHHLEKVLTVPFLGDIPKSEENEVVIASNSRSSAAEAIRIVRTNLEFLLGKVDEGKAKTIFISSTLPKEGKTFVTVNLASTIALSGKKVLLIGMDIRSPKIDVYFNLPNRGLTNYLSKSKDDIQDYIIKNENFENFYILPSGVIAPNPVELLMNGKLDPLFEQLKKEYDYIIVDTAPMSLVTDTLLIAKYADAFVYVVRANYLDKSFLPLIESYYRQKRLPNMSVVLNDTLIRKTYGYGYGSYGYGAYGYGYGEVKKEKKWWKKLFRKG